jgi:hypothetical protein
VIPCSCVSDLIFPRVFWPRVRFGLLFFPHGSVLHLTRSVKAYLFFPVRLDFVLRHPVVQFFFPFFLLARRSAASHVRGFPLLDLLPRFPAGGFDFAPGCRTRFQSRARDRTQYAAPVCLVPFFVPLSTLGSAHAAPVTGSCFALRQARAQGIFSLLGFSGRWFLPKEFSVLGQARPLVRTARVSASSSHGHRR